MFLNIIRNHLKKFHRSYGTISHLPGRIYFIKFHNSKSLNIDSRYVSDTRHVTLRGTKIKGNFDDLPNLIFFSEAIDPVSNWTAFFTNPENKVR